nr:GNAT family N-acetyltransferase [Deinococcus humi]
MGLEVILDPESRVRCYLGRLNGEPVGTALNVHGKELVSVWAIGTVERARRHGIGAALTTGPLLEARAAGYGSAMLLSTEAGFPVYTRLGWEVQSTCPVHVGGQG